MPPVYLATALGLANRSPRLREMHHRPEATLARFADQRNHACRFPVPHSICENSTVDRKCPLDFQLKIGPADGLLRNVRDSLLLLQHPSERVLLLARQWKQCIAAPPWFAIRRTWGICNGGSVHGEQANFTRFVLGCMIKYRSKFLQVNTKYSCESSRRDLHNALL